MLASDEDLIQLEVRLIDACRRVYTRSSNSISLGDTHRTSSDRPGREEKPLLFSPYVSSTGTGEGRTGLRKSSSVNEFIRAILDFFIQKFHKHKSTKRK